MSLAVRAARAWGLALVALVPLGCARGARVRGDEAAPLPPGEARDARRVPRPPLVCTIEPPARMPARYLRTLEYAPDGYAPSGREPSSDLLLGDLLFHSPHTLGPRALSLGISCNTCHPNGATHPTLVVPTLNDEPGNVDVSTAFFRGRSDDRIANPINIPSLRGCRYTAPYGRDGRTFSLEEFVENVVQTEFDGQPLDHEELSALARYLLDLDFLPNQNLNTKSELTARAGAEAARGAEVFASPRAGFGGASCATCHPSSSFFTDGRVHRLGTGSPPSPHALDSGYETPTLLGSSETAPYFHDGRFATLGEVIAWFDRSFSLGLTSDERADLLSYLEAIGAVDRPADDRPLAQRLDQTFAYLDVYGATQQRVNVASVDAVSSALEHAPRPLMTRVEQARSELERLRAAAEHGAPSPRDVATARALRQELARLAADWAGLGRR